MKSRTGIPADAPSSLWMNMTSLCWKAAVRSTNPVPLLFQNGYLTISGYDRLFRAYRMNYPNEEVKYGSLECLAPVYLNLDKEPGPLDVRPH